MEKLIELLNKYNCNVLKRADEWKLKNSIDYPWTKYISLSSVWAWKIYLYVISKEFWFIKRLVDNDKIDTDKLLGIYWETSQSIWEPNKYELYSEYKRLLMLLALQDNPIEFLIHVLKENE